MAEGNDGQRSQSSLGQKNIVERPRRNRLTRWNDKAWKTLAEMCKNLPVDASVWLYMLEHEIRVQRVVNLLNFLKLDSYRKHIEYRAYGEIDRDKICDQWLQSDKNRDVSDEIGMIQTWNPSTNLVRIGQVKGSTL